ncbi:TetR/AcrR family transcriptional regulator [Lactobacillus sp. CBA3605]|uniref:TetR/AcrR family transcriptional regulator n=1 Tax=Lactobacillus sp. CBA3605 TaxID=2099788 RepID=UPI000CFA857B|nr:TetR/AcrR family transcriptional regulator [Lactobacillus sp. CBA3605]AVK60962.1 TetR/AcrR family transcriptional regulator [Lactobacillus sp. CBA3605]
MRKVTNELIIQTAELLLATDDDVTLAKIGHELNITHAALYKHFKNKDDLWTAVLKQWFSREIIAKITTPPAATPATVALKAWLWQLVNAKKTTYNTNPRMFALNTQYIDDRPLVLREVLQPAYLEINRIMGYETGGTAKAEAIMAALTVFMLPTFKETWNWPDYKERFDVLWELIEPGL